MQNKVQSARRVPYTQQFTPEQTPLNKLLPILRQQCGKKKGDLRAAIASAFFKEKADPKKLAGNTLIALRNYGIIDESNNLTEFGNQLLAAQRQIDEVQKILAKRLLFDLDGLGIVETLREMQKAGLKIELQSLPDELRQRGYEVSSNSSDLSGVLNWLRKAGIINKYDVVNDIYEQMVGVSTNTLEATKHLNAEQIAFLQAMVALNVQDWTPYNSIVKHAEELYFGEIKYNWKDIVQNILKPLSERGFIEYKKKTKQDKNTPEGRGGKVADVKPIRIFEKEFAAPLLNALYRAAGFTDIRSIRSKSLSEIVADIKQNSNPNKSGEALEILAIRLCQLLDLTFMGWRETDIEIAGGGEVDAMLYSDRLIYSRWQIQCKVGKTTLEAVAKEVGMQSVTLSSVILIVSTGQVTESAQVYRRKIISTSNLNIIFIDGSILEKVIKDNTYLVEALKKQAQDALNLKPKVAGLKGGRPSGGNADEMSEVAGQISSKPKKLTKQVKPAYTTHLGSMYQGDTLEILPFLIEKGFRAKLIITSPPFALVRKKEYGNEDSDSYIAWFEQFIPYFKQILEPGGSIVIDIGGAWIKGIPAKSVYHFKLLLKLCENGFYLAQDFYHYNPARLPTPAEWVTVRRLRVKDAMNNVWWLTLDPFVDADNRRVLAPYSDSMKSLLKNGYKPALRPSGHDISDKFQKDNGGAIPPNLLQFSNTESNSYYLRRCKQEGIKPHPARFPQALPDFFIKFLTKPGDLIIDPFGGSNVTGAAAESLGRRWIAIELDVDYVLGSRFRFEQSDEAAFKTQDSSRNDLLPFFSDTANSSTLDKISQAIENKALAVKGRNQGNLNKINNLPGFDPDFV